MYQNAYQEYVDNEILTASPARLVQLMYRGALDAIAAARKALATGDITARSHQISRASEILNELALSLDHSKAPELTRSLVELYDYMLRRLITANVQQEDAPLAEVEGLLVTLLEAWQQSALQETAAAEFTPPVGQYLSEPPVGYESVSYAW